MSAALALIAALASTMGVRMVGNNKDGIRGCETSHQDLDLDLDSPTGGVMVVQLKKNVIV